MSKQEDKDYLDSFSIGTNSTGGCLKVYLPSDNTEKQRIIKECIFMYNQIVKGADLQRELSRDPLKR